MLAWSVHLDICRRVFGWGYCTEDLRDLDALIDRYGVHDVGRRDRLRDPVRLAALPTKCCLCLEECSCGEECFKRLLRVLEERVGDLGRFLHDVAARVAQQSMLPRSLRDPVVDRAWRLLGVVASSYIEEFARKGDQAEKAVLAWYFATGSMLPISKRKLVYALLHHVVDLMVWYIAREPVGVITPERVLERVEKNEKYKSVVSKLDYVLCGVEENDSRCVPPSTIL